MSLFGMLDGFVSLHDVVGRLQHADLSERLQGLHDFDKVRRPCGRTTAPVRHEATCSCTNQGTDGS